MMPKTIRVTTTRKEGKQAGIELIINYQKAVSLLMEELKKEGIEQENMEIIVNEVCQHLIKEMGVKKIMSATPELFIFHEHSKN